MTEKRSDLSYCIAKLSLAKRSLAEPSTAKHRHGGGQSPTVIIILQSKA